MKKQPKTGDLVKYIGAKRKGTGSELDIRITGIVVSRAAGWADVAWSDGQRGVIRDSAIEVINES